MMYKFVLKKRELTYNPYIEQLQKNSDIRIKNNKDYQLLLKKIKNAEEDDDDIEEDGDIEDELDGENENSSGQNDLQLIETYNIMKDLILLNKK